MNKINQVSDPPQFDDPRHKDACGLLCGMLAKKRPVLDLLQALDKISHRGGDGLGIQFKIEDSVLNKEAKSAKFTTKEVKPSGTNWVVLMVQIPIIFDQNRAVEEVFGILKTNGVQAVYGTPISKPTADHAQVVTWRFGGYDSLDNEKSLGLRLYMLKNEINSLSQSSDFPLNFFATSCSDQNMVLYKIVGRLKEFLACFGRTNLAKLHSNLFIAHVRYSTNSLPRHRSAQPFSFLAHNGEINNINAIRAEMETYSIPLSGALSDSADLDSLTDFLMHQWGYSLLEALYFIFPKKWFLTPRGFELENVKQAQRLKLRDFVKRAFRSIRAEGPAALVATDGKQIIGRIDAMGLRPLFAIESLEGDHFFTSEAGSVLGLATVKKLWMFRPGEIAAMERQGEKVHLLCDSSIENQVLDHLYMGELGSDERVLNQIIHPTSKTCWLIQPAETPEYILDTAPNQDREKYRFIRGLSKRVTAGLSSLVLKNKELGSGTGWRGGLAIHQKHPVLFSDFLKAMTAQVTAPTISAEHEMAAMDASMLLGEQIHPFFGAKGKVRSKNIQLALPLVFGFEDLTKEGRLLVQNVADLFGVISTQDLRKEEYKFLNPHFVDISFDLKEGEESSLRLQWEIHRVLRDVEQLASEQANSLVILSDYSAFRRPKQVGLYPELIVGALDKHLSNLGLRQHVQIVIQSEEIVSPHGIFACLQLGADAVSPTLLCREMIELSLAQGPKIVGALTQSLEALLKALAIMYGRIATNHFAAGRGGRRVAAIGLDQAVTDSMGLNPSYGQGMGFSELYAMAVQKDQILWNHPNSLHEVQPDSMSMPQAQAMYGVLGGFDGFTRLTAQIKGATGKLDNLFHLSTHEPDVLNSNDMNERLAYFSGLTSSETAQKILVLFDQYQKHPVNFIDGLLLKESHVLLDDGWKKIKTGLDGRDKNQMIGAISFGANSLIVHQLYAEVMDEQGAMSNGGEGGVPSNIR
ncbi:MAG: glutamate synthase central domain-containing protein, partial [SAR324 cluster bacterium]|nr:glutamate synthase central domain-containing protein [SAR324 cluster bacterium]